MERLSIFVMGSPRFELNEILIELPRRKATALLAYLAVNGERQHRAALSTFFWPASARTPAYAYLRATIWEINRTLGEGWLLANRVSVGINPDANVYLDLKEYRHLLDQVILHTHSNDEGCQDCAIILEAAARLSHGDFI